MRRQAAIVYWSVAALLVLYIFVVMQDSAARRSLALAEKSQALKVADQKLTALTTENQALQALALENAAPVPLFKERLEGKIEGGAASVIYVSYPQNWKTVSKEERWRAPLAGGRLRDYDVDLEHVLTTEGAPVKLARLGIAYAPKPWSVEAYSRAFVPVAWWNVQEREPKSSETRGDWTIAWQELTVKGNGSGGKYFMGFAAREVGGEIKDAWVIVLGGSPSYLRYYEPTFKEIMKSITLP